MAIFSWKPDYSVKVAEIDRQHMDLVKMTNDLFEAMSLGKGQDVLRPILSKLATYAITHFGYEETLMKKYNYPEDADHKGEHQNFIAKVDELNKKLASGQSFITMEVGNFLKDWLLNHISKVDKKFGSYLNEQGVN